MLGISVAVVAFVAMEAVAAMSHRFVMHGPGMGWHASHHAARPTARFERNDLFPVVGSAVAIGAFSLGAFTPLHVMTWVGIGMTAYGAAYLLAHEVYVHERVRVPLPRLRYFEWLRRAHRVHHLFGHAPYGFVIPVVPRAMLERADAVTRDPLARSAG